MYRHFKKSFFFCLSTFLLVFVFTAFQTSKIFAADGVQLACDADEGFFQKAWNAYKENSVRKTSANFLITSTVDFSSFVATGRTLSDIQKCTARALLDANAITEDNIPENCRITTEECADLDRTYAAAGFTQDFSKTQSAGSLIGVANILYGVVQHEPVPVNLAYYWNDSISKVPLVNTALAATTPQYPGPYLDIVLAVWKLTRNVSYGIIAISMLVVGFMIMTKKRISQQAVVTAQMALPRIVIALILITFSYPIGAIGASLAYELNFSTQSIVNTIDWSSTGQGGQAIPAVVTLILIIGVLIVTQGGAAVVLGVIFIALIIIEIILFILILIKTLLIYFKMLMSIISAPVIFAIGAIPGNEDKTTNWFKQFLVYILSIPLMWTIVYVTWQFCWSMVLAIFASGGAAWGTSLMGILASPFLFIFGLNFARQLPDKLDTAIMGKKR